MGRGGEENEIEYSLSLGEDFRRTVSIFLPPSVDFPHKSLALTVALLKYLTLTVISKHERDSAKTEKIDQR